MARARFRHVQVLVSLAELGSVRRTADAIGMTQPGVTQILGDLETLLGAQLFQRHARGVRPTPACSEFLPMAHQMLLAMSTAADAMAALNDQGKGVVRMVGSTAGINGLLVRALPDFNDHMPDIQVQLSNAENDNLLHATARGEFDVACCRQPAVLPEGWAFEALMEDRFVIACAANHPLARRRSLNWPDLAHQVWLPTPASSAAREQFDRLCEHFDAPPRICQVVTRVPSMTWALLRHQPLLTVAPWGVVRQLVDAGELAVLRMKEPLPLAALGIMLPIEGASSATLRLVEHLRHFARRKAELGQAPATPSAPTP